MSDTVNVDTLVERLGRVLVQYERAMIELGWTIADVRYKETLFDLAVRARRVAELEAALREVERYFGSELPPAGFPLGAVRAALAGDGGGAEVPRCTQCGRDLHGYRGPLCRYCDPRAFSE